MYVTRITCFAAGRSVPPTAVLGGSSRFPTGVGPPGRLWSSGPTPLVGRSLPSVLPGSDPNVPVKKKKSVRYNLMHCSTYTRPDQRLLNPASESDVTILVSISSHDFI